MAKTIIVLDDNPSERICCAIGANGVHSDAFMVPKVQPLEFPHRRYRAWDEGSYNFVGNNNPAAKECDFWHRRESSIDELEREYFLGDAVEEWKDICREVDEAADED